MSSAKALTLLATFGIAACCEARPSFTPEPITSVDFERHVTYLDLDPAESLAARTIFQAYQAEYNAAIAVHDQLLAWIWSNSPSEYGAYDPDLQRAVAADQRSVEARLQTGLRRLEDRYFALLGSLDVRLVERAQDLRRAHLRKRMLREGALPEGTPYGVTLDVRILAEETVPQQEWQPEIAELLTRYEKQLDSILKELDELLWSHSYEGKQSLRQLRELANDPSTTRTELDKASRPVADFYARPHLLCAQIRAANKATVEAISALMPEDVADQFGSRAHRSIAGYMYDPEKPSPTALVARCLKLPGVTDEQRESLLILRDAFVAVQARATLKIEPVYGRLNAADLQRRKFKSWVRAIVARESLEDPTQELTGEFNDALERWRLTRERFSNEIRDLLAAAQWERLQ